ncbi:hypothetical protein HPB48_017994 [Haemaphysalis longicornis]|uniref:YqaJ viral recombinase domain-containing protein n=1 Tax=Haemaphysalis longicornis TaxID=44386 RepID=A0A9J6F831_HAELO|nr:hypothetical protein HPB48_017994 [Haemaphysalis longicornis]
MVICFVYVVVTEPKAHFGRQLFLQGWLPRLVQTRGGGDRLHKQTRRKILHGLPRAWGKPSARPTLDTKKEIKELFSSKYEARFLELFKLFNISSYSRALFCIALFNLKMICTGRPLPAPVLKPLCPKTVHAQFPDVRCAFADMIACEGSNDENADPTRASTDAVDESLNLGVEAVRSLLEEVRETYMQPCSWRVRQKHRSRIQELSVALELPIQEVGLVVHPKQPWLCGSPDGLVITGETTRLVEIKCPFVLQDSMLIDYEEGISHVKFLQYVDDKLTLQSSHAYYTQLMVMLYVLNLTDALFFAYYKKKKTSITVEVKRNNKFLAEHIPKLECFYFTPLLKALAKK